MTPALAKKIAGDFGTPVYVYDQVALEQQAAAALAFPNAYGLTARFAMKALPSITILRLFERLGLHFDASSGYEVLRALRAKIPPQKISLSTQEFPHFFHELLNSGVTVNACSLRQLELIGMFFQNAKIGVRINPGKGSGGTGKTNVGGPDASFGIWHEHIGAILEIAKKYALKIVRIHTHIGSGSDPLVWQEVSKLSIELAKFFPEVTTLNLGGGYKVARVAAEKGTDLQIVGAPIKAAFEKFFAETGRRLHLEIEPGTFLVANAGAIISRVQDVTDTGVNGRNFLKLDIGMTELLRPSLYGAQHPVALVPQNDTDENGTARDYVIVGHCCESGDLISCAPGEPETLLARNLPVAKTGDLCVIGGAGAYCSAMSAKNYNSFPEAAEVLVDTAQQPKLIRRRQTLEQILENEILPAGY